MTTVSEIYDSFLSTISDYSLISANLTDGEIDEVLFTYLKKAIAKFYRCKNNLEIVEDITGEKEFTVDLHPMEIEVLVSLMLVEYIRPQVLSSESLRQSLSDKDFKIYSQANQLRELRLLYNVLKADANKAITEYTYLDLGVDNK